MRSVLLAVLVIGCGHANLVVKSARGGVIELRGDPGRAREEADQLMADECGLNNFAIASEADEPVTAGSPTTARRIHFVCGNLLPADAGA